MRKLKLEVQISIDGYIAETNGNTNWMIWNWGPVWKWDKKLQNYHTELTKSVYCILLSRQMADEGFIDHCEKIAQTLKIHSMRFQNISLKQKKLYLVTRFTKPTIFPEGGIMQT